MQGTLWRNEEAKAKPVVLMAEPAIVAKLVALGVSEATAKKYGRKQAFAVLRSLEAKREGELARQREAKRIAAATPQRPPAPILDGKTLPTMGGRHLLLRLDAARDYAGELAAPVIDYAALRHGLRGIADLLTDDETLTVARLVAGMLTATKEVYPLCGRTAQVEADERDLDDFSDCPLPPMEDSPDAEPAPDYWDSRDEAERDECLSGLPERQDP